MKKWTKIKVDKSIKPLHYSKRKQVELIIGNDYFVSFGNNYVHKCKLTKIDEARNPKQITIEIPIRPKSKDGFKDIDGTISHHWVSTHLIFADEIGLTPEEAVMNEMTF